MFSQVDSSDIRKVGGTGLGLYITKQIIERHNGVIDYESEVGVGTTFYIELDQITE
jgi:signal transduction histidine kinase